MITDIKQLPRYVHKYSPKTARQYMHVFNTVFESTKDINRAVMASNSVLKKRFMGKENNYDKNESDYINYLLDVWLGNLK